MENQTHEIKADSQAQIRAKWGKAVGQGGLTGFLALPEILVRAQSKLELSSTEMMVLINVLLHWWYADRMPFPSNVVIAKRIGINPRTVQRSLESLERKKLVERKVKRFYDDKNNCHSSHREIDLTELVKRLSDYAEYYGDLTPKSQR